MYSICADIKPFDNPCATLATNVNILKHDKHAIMVVIAVTKKIAPGRTAKTRNPATRDVVKTTTSGNNSTWIIVKPVKGFGLLVPHG